MFCSQCGNPVDAGKNFCGKCGTKVAKPAPAAADEPTPSLANAPSPTIVESRTQFMSAQTLALEAETSGHPAKRGNGVLIMTIAGVVVIAAGLGIYFGTDLIRPAAKQAPVAVEPTGPPLALPTQPPVVSARAPSERKESPLWEPTEPTPGEPQPPAQAEPVKPASPPQAKVVPGEEPPPPSRRAPRERVPVDRNVPPAQARLTPTAAIYETVRPTVVYAEASTSSRVVANIESNVRLTVVGANNEWLELRSRLGNPPGFVRRDHARPLSGNN